MEAVLLESGARQDLKEFVSLAKRVGISARYLKNYSSFPKKETQKSISRKREMEIINGNMEEWEKRFERMEALMAENLKGFAEIRERQRENAKGFAELRELQKKTDKQIEETSADLKELQKEFGNTSRNIGHHAEQYFRDVFKEKLSFGGEKYDNMIPNLKFEGKESCEFDIVLINGKSVAIIEAKNRIHPDYIKILAEDKVAQLRKHFPKFKDYNLYLGVAGFSFDEFVIQEAQKYGVGIIRQVGDAVEIDDKKLKVY
jgi:hypothetical protein